VILGPSANVRAPRAAAASGLHPELVARLQRLERRRRRLLIASGLLWALAILSVALAAAACLERAIVPEAAGRRALQVLAVAPAAAALAGVFATALRRRTRAQLAELFESAFPDRAELLRSAVTLGATEGAAARDSLSFRSALQAQAAARAAALDPARVLPWTRLGRPALVLAAAALCFPLPAALFGRGYFFGVARVLAPGSASRWSSTKIDLRIAGRPLDADAARPAIFAEDEPIDVQALVHGPAGAAPELRFRAEAPGAGLQRGAAAEGALAMAADASAGPARAARSWLARLEGPRGPLTLSARAGDGESPPLRIETAPRPSVERFDFTCTPPLYLQREPQRVAGKDGDVRAWRGSRLRLEVLAGEPLRSARLRARFQDGTESDIELAVDGSRAVLDAIELEQSSRYRIAIESARTGLRNDWGPEHSIDVLPDAPPELAVLAPEASLKLRPRQTLRRALRATDDLEIAQVVEEVEAAGRPPQRRVLIDGPKRERVEFAGDLDLSPLALAPGEVLRLVYRARDAAGNETAAPPITIEIVAGGAPPVDAEWSALYRRLVERIDASAGGAAAAAASSSRERAAQWIADAEPAPALAIRCLAAAPDAESARDLLLIHAALMSWIEDRARALERAPAAWLESQGGEAWAAFADAGRALGRASRRLFDEGRTLGARRRLISVHSRLEGGGADRRRAAPAAEPQEPAGLEPLLRERGALRDEIERLLPVLESLLRPAAAESPAAAGAAPGLESGLRRAFESLDRIDDPQAWRGVQDAMQRLLLDTDYFCRRLALDAAAARVELGRIAGGEAAGLRRLVELGAPAAAARSDAEARLRELPADATPAALAAALAPLDATAARCGPNVCDDLGAPALAGRIARTRGRAAAAGVFGDAWARRIRADHALLERVLLHLERVEARSALRELGEAVRRNDAPACKDALERWRERAAEPGAPASAILAALARHFGVLEAIHALWTPARLAAESLDAIEDAPGSRFARRDLALRLRALSMELPAAARAAGAPESADLAGAIEALRAAPEWRAIESFEPDPSPGAAPAASEAIAASLRQVRERLDALGARETPAVRAAREALRALLPPLAERLAAALERARAARDRARAALDEHRGERPLDPDRLEALLAAESEAAAELGGLRDDLISEQDARDLGDAEARRSARAADAALAALAEPTPSAEELLLSLPALPAPDQRRRLEAALGLETARVERIERLLEALAEGSAGAEAMARLEKELGIADRLDARYEPIEALSGLRSEQAQLAAATAASSAAELDRRLEEQRKLQQELESMLERRPGGEAEIASRFAELIARAVEELRGEEEERRRLDAELEAALQAQSKSIELLAAELERFAADLGAFASEDLGVARAESADASTPAAGARRAAVEAVPLARGAAAGFPGSVAAAGAAVVAAASRCREAERGFDAARRSAAGGSEPEEAEGAFDVTAASAGALEGVDSILRRVRALAQNDARRQSIRTAEDAGFLAERDRIQRGASGSRVEALRRLEGARRQVEEARIGEDVEVRSAWRTLAADLERRREALRKDAERLRRGAGAAVEAAARRRLEEAARRLETAGEPLDWAARELDASRAADGIEFLERAAARLGGGAPRGFGGALHLELAAARTRAAELAGRGEALAGRLAGLDKVWDDDRRRARERERAFAARVEETGAVIGRARELGRALDGADLAGLDAALDAIEARALPGIGRREEILAETLAAPEDRGRLAENSGGIAAALADARAALEALLKRAPRPSEHEGGGAAGAGEDPRAAPAMSAALDAMAGASASLARGDAAGAAGAQRRAAEQLERALRAMADGLAEARERGDLDGREGSERRGGGDGGDDGAGSTGSERTGGAGSDLVLPGGLRGDDWARLPAERRREILEGWRESVSPRYRERVEAYFRALAERAVGAAPGRDGR
jgi:hypothetical protein